MSDSLDKLKKFKQNIILRHCQVRGRILYEMWITTGKKIFLCYAQIILRFPMGLSTRLFTRSKFVEVR